MVAHYNSVQGLLRASRSLTGLWAIADERACALERVDNDGRKEVLRTFCLLGRWMLIGAQFKRIENDSLAALLAPEERVIEVGSARWLELMSHPELQEPLKLGEGLPSPHERACCQCCLECWTVETAHDFVMLGGLRFHSECALKVERTEAMSKLEVLCFELNHTLSQVVAFEVTDEAPFSMQGRLLAGLFKVTYVQGVYFVHLPDIKLKVLAPAALPTPPKDSQQGNVIRFHDREELICYLRDWSLLGKGIAA